MCASNFCSCKLSCFSEPGTYIEAFFEVYFEFEDKEITILGRKWYPKITALSAYLALIVLLMRQLYWMLYQPKFMNSVMVYPLKEWRN